VGLLVCAACCAFGASPPKEDTTWKNYYNPQGSYCVDYLSRWVSGDAFEGAGFFLNPPLNPHFSSLAEMDVAVLDDDPEAASLPDEVKMHMDGLSKFVLAEKMHLQEQHDTELSGGKALFSSATYYDPQNRAPMVEELVFADHSGKLYRLTLSTGADQLQRFEPLFQHLVRSFQFDCAPHPVSRDFGYSPYARRVSWAAN
jgi:hypothetical protein